MSFRISFALPFSHGKKKCMLYYSTQLVKNLLLICINFLGVFAWYVRDIDYARKYYSWLLIFITCVLVCGREKRELS